MDFSITRETEALVAHVTSYVNDELIPLEHILLNGGFSAVLPEIEAKRAYLKTSGLWAPAYPKQYGGMGLPLSVFALVSEALGRSPLGHFTFNCQAPDVGNFELLEHSATEEQKEPWLSRMASGEIRSCFAMTERDNSGANPLFMRSTAFRDGNSYVLNGNKWFITGADGASLCIAMMVTDPSAKPRDQTSMFIVPTDAPGFNRVRNTPVMGHAGMGWSSHSEIQFDNCRVPVSSLLGKEGDGFRLAQARLGPGRIHHCMRWIGICSRVMEMMARRANERTIRDNDGKLSDSDVVRSWIAECAAAVQGARLMTLYAVWRIETVGAKKARADISMIKYHVANVLQMVIDRAIQVHGALGVSDYTVLSLWYREERAARIFDGPDEVHKLEVARQYLSGLDQEQCEEARVSGGSI